MGKSLSSTSNLSSSTPIMKFVYPSKQDVFKSYDGVFGGGCLPYTKKTHLKQSWLENYLYNWRSESRSRSKAMPHIKSYTRISPDDTKAAYFILTSANVSKAAWGSVNKAGDSCQIQSYEAGVLLLPKFVNGKDFFDIGESGFKLPYDLPLKKYDNHSPWFRDYLNEAMAMAS